MSFSHTVGRRRRAAPYPLPHTRSVLSCFPPLQGYAFDLTPAPFKYYYTVPDGLGCDGVQARCVLQMCVWAGRPAAAP